MTPATCLANRGLVKLAMKRFRGAAEDLGGVLSVTAKASKDTTVEGVATASAATGVGAATLAGGALDCLDSELGRALAEGRLQDRASREVSLCLEPTGVILRIITPEPGRSGFIAKRMPRSAPTKIAHFSWFVFHAWCQYYI